MFWKRCLALGLAVSLALAGCYQGEWKIGIEVPVSSKHKLLATRDVESWELEQTPTPYVVRLRGEMTQRCRGAHFGSSRRTDVGRFVRVGGQHWKRAAIATGVLGGAGLLVGGSGWMSRDAGPFALPAMYAVGGLLGAAGLVNCILAINKSSPVRWALCGSMFGSGAAIALGAGLSHIASGAELDPLNPMRQTERIPVIGTEVFQGLTYAGVGTLGMAGIAGIAAGLWRGETERKRVVETPQVALWDEQRGEQVCGPARPMVGRTATLEIVAERATQGPGSENDPLKLRVALGDEGVAAVDLRPLRQALSSCGVLRVQVNPDTLYEQFVPDFVPPQPPPQVPVSRPIHGRILPEGGLTLQGLEGRPRRASGRQPVPGFSDEVIGAIERRCRAEIARGGELRTEPPHGEWVATRSERPRGEPTGPTSPPSPAGEVAGEPEFADPPEAEPAPAPSQAPQKAECAAETKQTIQRDCEHSCGKTLEAAPCVFERRKCLIDARYSQQKQRDLELCDLAWEKCLFKSGVSPGAWARCIEACQRKNEASMCR
ncbi:MAG: hypothetical protein NZ890_17915 [Myxococcota bacterium]|nr:hypothetical protein [Myxococcota bacterium]